MSKVVVIGAGIAGLAAGALLAREGHEVTILESQANVGGRAGRWETEGFRFDTGPSWYLMPEVFDHFYKLLGTSADEQLDLVNLDPGYRVYFEGDDAPVDIAYERADNIALFESMEKGAGRRLDEYLVSAKETYDLALEHFLYTSFQSIRKVATRDVVDRTGRLLRLLLQPLSSFAARTVRNKKLRQILGYPAVFLGSSPYTTPSMFHLMSHLDLEDGVRYPMGGFTRLIESIADLARAEGVQIITRAPVRQIVTQEGHVTAVEYMMNGKDVHFMDADIVVSAADLHHTETQLLSEPERTYPQSYWDERTAGPGALLIMLGVKGDLPELEHHTLLFAKDWRKGFEQIFGDDPSVPSPASLYICKPSGVDPDVAPDNHENLFVLVPIPADPSIGRGDIGGDGDARLEKLADTVIQQISDWAGIPDLADRIVLRRTVGPQNFVEELNSWKGTALGPAHTLRQSAFFRTGNISKKVKGLYYVGGSTIPGIGLPMCLISAELLIKRLRNDTSTTALPEPLESTHTAEEAAAVEELEDQQEEIADDQRDTASLRRRLTGWISGFELPKLELPERKLRVEATDEDLVLVDDRIEEESPPDAVPADAVPADAVPADAVPEVSVDADSVDAATPAERPVRAGAQVAAAGSAAMGLAANSFRSAVERMRAIDLSKITLPKVALPARGPAEAADAEVLAVDAELVVAADADVEAADVELESADGVPVDVELLGDETVDGEVVQTESVDDEEVVEPEWVDEEVVETESDDEQVVEPESVDDESADDETADDEPGEYEPVADAAAADADGAEGAPESDNESVDAQGEVSEMGAPSDGDEPEPEPEPDPDDTNPRDDHDHEEEGSLVDLVKSWARDLHESDPDRR